MSESPPANLFSSRVDPAGVLQALRASGAKVRVDGPDDAWRAGEAIFRGGGLFSRAKRMIIRHNPEYYAPESFRKQLPGMQNYAMSGPVPPPEPVLAAMRSFRFNVNFSPEAFSEEDPRWRAVLAACQHLDGIIMLPGVFLDGQGRVLHRLDGPPDPGATAPARTAPNPVLVPTGGLYDRSAGRFSLPPYREAAVTALAELGFTAPWWVSTDEVELKPPETIARRLLALQALFDWVVKARIPDEAIRGYIERNGLDEALTESEAASFAKSRTEAQEEVNQVGWRLENMWPLAWALGFEPAPDPATPMLDVPRIDALWDFLPDPTDEGATIASFLADKSPRTADEVGAMEDLFLCAHHAVRSAAHFGLATVPDGFHPILDGGCVHERRHALSWMVGGDVSWDETQLGT